MKKTTLLLLFFAITSFIFSQVSVQKENIIVGKSITGEPINGIKYDFGENIYRIRFDSTTQTFSIQIRGIKKNKKYYKNKGDLALFELGSNEILWSRKINYGKVRVEQYDGVLTLNQRQKALSTRINLKTGEDLWNSYILIYATIPNLNVALGYRMKFFRSGYESPLSEKLTCIDLRSGKALWQRPIDNTFGWNNAFNIDDENIIVKSSGLHQINLKTGIGWDYHAITGKSSTFVDDTDFESNIDADSLSYYYASMDKLVCLSHEGEVKWKVSLPEETTSSSLFTDSLYLYLINHGQALRNNKLHSFGKAYLAIYDKNNGRRLHFFSTNLEKNPLISFLRNEENNTIDLFFKDRAIRFSMSPETMNTVMYDNNHGIIEDIVGRFRLYIKNDSLYQSLYSTDSMSMFFVTDKNTIVKANKNLELTEQCPVSELYFRRTATKELTFLHRNNQIIVIDNSDKITAQLELGKDLFIIKNKLYALQESSIIEIDIENILKH